MLVNVKSISIKNFLSIQDLDFSFKSYGLWLIYGHVISGASDSNGVGKSTIIDALLWCLFDETFKILKSKDEIINNKAKKNCSVIVEFVVGENNYRVERHRKHEKNGNQVMLYCNDKNLSLPADRETNAAIEKILGYTFKSFQENVVFTGRSLKFLECGDTEKKQIFDTVIRSELYEQAIVKTKEIVASIEKELEPAKNELIRKESEKKQVETYTAQLRIQSTNFDLAKQEDLRTIKAELDSIKIDLTEYGDLQVPKYPSTSQELSEADKNREIYKANYKNKKEQLDSLSKQIAKIELQKLKLEDGMTKGICVMCGQKLPDSNPHVQQNLDNLVKEITEILEQQQKLAVEIDELVKLGKENKDKYDALKKNAEADDENYKIELKKYDELRIKKETQQLTKVKVQNLNTRIEEVQKRENNYIKLIESNEDTIKALDSDIAGIRSVIDNKTIEMENTKYWITGFKKIKGLLISLVTPIMNKLAQQYADLITHGDFQIKFTTQKQNKDGSFKDTFDVLVTRVNGGSSYGALSSGEMRRVDLITMFVLDGLKRMNCLNDVNIRIFDEVCDSLDSYGVDAVIKLLQQESQTKQIFVISHNDDLKGMFENTLKLIKENGVTRLAD
jgi:DNA repair exonuclease SbcCD ATPase subunit